MSARYGKPGAAGSQSGLDCFRDRFGQQLPPAAALRQTLRPPVLRPPCPADRGATIQHWQLRDLVHCPQRDDELYVVHKSRILGYDLRSGATSIAQDLRFEVRGSLLWYGLLQIKHSPCCLPDQHIILDLTRRCVCRPHRCCSPLA